MTEKPLFYSLGAGWIYPMTGSPLENHWLNVSHGCVESLTAQPVYERIFLGGGNVILPAAANMHTHWELSQLEPAPLDVPGRKMADWVAALLAFRRSPAYDARKGIETALHRTEWLESTAAAADIVPPGIPAAACKKNGIRIFPFTELICWRKEQAAGILTGLQAGYGLSPHAPQTVCPELLEGAVRLGKPAAMHLAETEEELQLLQRHSGPLLKMMWHADPDYNPKTVLLGQRPMDYLQLLSQAPKTLIIHGNYLSDDELRFLAAHRETMSVVYCPRSHAYFRHPPYPLRKMLDFRVRVLLGTDSAASVPDWDMTAEICFAAAQHPAVPAETFYRMAADGAAVLDLPDCGTIQPGSPDRFMVLPV